MNIFFNHNNESNTIDKRLENNYGVLSKELIFRSDFAEGTILSVSYTSWILHKISINSSNYDSIKFDVKKSKFVFINLHQKNTLVIKTNTFSSKLDAYGKGIFTDDLEDTLITPIKNEQQFVVLELKEKYFDQVFFHPSLRQNLFTLFHEKSFFNFQFSENPYTILEPIFHPSKRGLCQLMFLNSKIFELLSEATNQLEIDTNSYYIHPYQKQLDQVKNIIDSELQIQYSIKELAKIVGLNTSYLKKYFKEVFDLTIFEYASNKRIQYAKELLTTQNTSIGNIASEIGYQHSAHFSYAFKKQTGMTPNQYRKQKTTSTILP
ncbi:helix-turn-helix domain-containing protein [Flavicella marina]|uniref:helix-turn-helix domain-containing protein n=1 Tax=Flavicella marina TaxID=1475951 RepID=UPI0012658D2B|nr:AraC family transcriptional regulator [Flavicella marina]